MKYKTLILAIAAFSSGAFAASTGTLNLEGTVLLVNEINISAEAVAINLNVLQGEAGAKVAVVEETSNDRSGYVIQMSSLHAGKLQHSVDNTKSTSYQLSYDGGAYTSPTTIPVTVKTVSSLSGLTVSDSDVLINLTDYPTAIAGVYSDIVTFSIVAN